MRPLNSELGFTLIEIIVVLVIMGIMAIGLNSAITYGVQSFVFARKADQLSQKAQLAMARINKELTDMTAVSTSTVPSASQIRYTASSGDIYVLSKSGTQILLNRNDTGAQILIDGLNTSNNGKDFLSYVLLDGAGSTTLSNLATIKVQIYLDSPSGGTLEYQSTINPRANGILTAPKLN